MKADRGNNITGIGSGYIIQFANTNRCMAWRLLQQIKIVYYNFSFTLYHFSLYSLFLLLSITQSNNNYRFFSIQINTSYSLTSWTDCSSHKTYYHNSHFWSLVLQLPNQSPIMTLNLIYQNVRGLRSKTHELTMSIDTNDSDIICLTESWLNDSVINSELCSDGF